MSLLFTRSGVLDTVQDMGRTGYAHWGINPSGAMDVFAMMAANALVGNDFNQGVVEMHYPTAELHFRKSAIISLTGADFSAQINGVNVASWKTICVPENSIVSFIKKNYGFRSYLAVHGGFNIKFWLKSQSTNLKVRHGGYHGRPLRKDDELQFNRHVNKTSLEISSWSFSHQTVYDHAEHIHFLPAEGWHSMTQSNKNQLQAQAIKILPTSDRMGYYLDNEPIVLSDKKEKLSSAVAFGTIQILPTGKLICLMADHQTTGGYPTLGSVISADLPKLAQCTPGTSIYLQPVVIEEAEKRLLSLHQHIRVAASSLTQKLKDIIA